jgi:serine phosphatase RsbU (regulator of sigma subunit)
VEALVAGVPSGDRRVLAGERELASDPGPRDELLAQTVRQRTQAARRRELSAQARLQAAARRDAAADARDRAALARDAAAAQRNVAMAQLDAATQRDEDSQPLTGAELVVRAAGQRRRAAQRRTMAAQQRELAAEDRHAAARDRAEAASERLQALVDREALLREIRREQGGRAEAKRHQHSAEDLARTLQRSLSPPRLPRVDGLDVAAHYEPFAPEEVGGDFYDLFPLAGGRSGFFLGDVCGKGPEAATLTSLARYTMRTAAMLREGPAAILADLNVALLADSASFMQNCTVVYGQIDMDTQRTRVLLAAAGHPAPIIVRADGSVEVTPARGTLLGAIEQPRFATCEVELALGDAIFVYSDGILDTEIAGVRVDEDRLAGMLEGAPDASAQALVDRLVDELQRIDRPLRDDVALMALRRTPAG